MQPFRIGPVRFEARLEWLRRKQEEGAISKTSRRRIEAAWAGKQLGNRRPSHDSTSEAGILKSSGNCPYICSIVTEGLGYGAGLEKALIAARIAMTGIALIWQTPSRALEGMNLLFDGPAHSQDLLCFLRNGIVSTGSTWSRLPHGPLIKRVDWEEILADYQAYSEVIGEVLSYVVSPLGTISRPKLMNTLAQSLLWFHEGCRETVTLMAIVKFSASLDALASGGRAGGICRLINARLGLMDNQPIRQDGPVLKQAIEKIYNDGRSRTIHGVNDKVGHDWAETRGLAEQFGRLCLLACIEWAANNRDKDDPLLLRA